MSKLTNLDVMGFLGNIEKTSTVEILEEGKEKNDLINSAKKRGILVEGSRDLGLLKTIFLFTDTPNSNGAIVPSKEFKKIFPQIIGKPMNVGHDRRAVVGFYTDYRYIQKENKAITYAVIFKSNFPDVYEKAKEFQKKGKLSSSFEIWSKNKKVVNEEDKTYSLNNMELAGGALIFQEHGEMPAFKGADVLAIGKKELLGIINDKCLCYASKYKNGKIFCANGECEEIEELEIAESFNCECIKCGYKTTSENHCNSMKCSKCGGDMRREGYPGTGRPDLSPNVTAKTKCANCEEEFTSEGIMLDSRTGGLKCPNCFAIVDKTGKMLYPPQIKDFRISCLNCKTNNWLILSKTADKAKLRCLDCSRQFKIEFVSADVHKALNKFSFLYIGTASCPQCSKVISYSTTSHLTHREFECPKCNMRFPIDITKNKYRNIANIEEIISDKLEKSAKEGGNSKMTFKLEVSKFHRSYDGDIDAWLNEELIAEDGEKAEDGTLIIAEQITTKERKELSDDSFALVSRVKNKETAKTRKIRLFLSHDEAHVKNVLSRLTQDKSKDILESMGVSTDRVLSKVLNKAKSLGMNEVLIQRAEDCERLGIDVSKPASVESEIPKQVIKEENPLKKAVNKLAKKLIIARNELADMKLAMDIKIGFYKDNAKEIIKRRSELKEYASELTDEQILSDKDFEIATLKKKLSDKVVVEEKIETSSDRVGDKVIASDNYYNNVRNEVNESAFGRK